MSLGLSGTVKTRSAALAEIHPDPRERPATGSRTVAVV